MFKNNISSANSAYLLFDNCSVGAYFCYESEGTMYVYISCDSETDDSGKLISDLFRKDVSSSSSKSIVVWIRNENNITISRLKSEFSFDEGAYGMTEFIMKRADFRAFETRQDITVTGYEDEHIDTYLNLLNRAMTYHKNKSYYTDRREEYRKKLCKIMMRDISKPFGIKLT